MKRIIMLSEPGYHMDQQKRVSTIAGELLLLARKVAHAHETPAWGRTRTLELIDALLSLATVHGFTQTEVLRQLLVFDIDIAHVQMLSKAAFDNVPLPDLLNAIRHTRIYTDLHEPEVNESMKNGKT